MPRLLTVLAVLPSLALAAAGGGPSHQEISTVTVGLRKATAEEGAPGVAGLAAFVLRRTGDLAHDLVVNVDVAGTALPDKDYAALKPFYVIPAGQDRVTVVVKTLADPDVEGPETVDLALAPGDGYVAGDPASRTVTITESGSEPAF